MEVEIHDTKETFKINDVEAKVENGATNQPEKTSLKSERSEAKSNVDLKLRPVNFGRSIHAKEDPEAGAETGKQRDREVENGATNQLEKTSLKSEKSEAKSNVDVKLRPVNYGTSIPAKEDPEAGAEAGKQRDPEVENVTTNQRVREVFHMDVAELIIERNA